MLILSLHIFYITCFLYNICEPFIYLLYQSTLHYLLDHSRNTRNIDIKTITPPHFIFQNLSFLRHLGIVPYVSKRQSSNNVVDVVRKLFFYYMMSQEDVFVTSRFMVRIPNQQSLWSPVKTIAFNRLTHALQLKKGLCVRKQGVSGPQNLENGEITKTNNTDLRVSYLDKHPLIVGARNKRMNDDKLTDVKTNRRLLGIFSSKY